MAWVPLHVHSQYSILDASLSIKDLAKRAAEYKMPAVALTDHGNLFGAVEFFKACESQSVKPLIGCEVYVAPSSRLEKAKLSGKRVAYNLPLIAKNDQGYHNLCALSSKGFLDGFYYFPRVDKELIKQYSAGLICLSGCMSGMVAQALLNDGEEAAKQEILWHRELFGEDYYLEIQRHPMSEEDLRADGIFEETWLEQKYQEFIQQQEKVNRSLIALSEELSIPLVATNDTHYLNREDWKAHEALLNVQSGEPCEIWEKDASGIPKFRVPNPKRRTYASHEMYFKSPEQMEQLFQDVPQAISNTLDIAEKCQLKLDFKTKHYPVFTPPSLENKECSEEERAQAVERFLRKLCDERIPERYREEELKKVQEKYPDQDPLQVVKDRLELEMSIIAPKGMCDYLLIVWDFIHWAKNQGIPVGPGRGSGAGSIVLYLIGITDIEPLRFNLFFERFINPERFSYPDIDVDICMDRRAEVIGYTLEKYGVENVAQIITFGKMKAKMVIKDVGRVLSIPLSTVNKIAALVPEDPNMTLERALELDKELSDWAGQDEDVGRVIKMGKILEGSIRNTGIHAAGVIICGDPLTNHIPICTAKDAEIPVTQYSMKFVEAVGMLKVDFLGLKTLTSIVTAVKMIEVSKGEKIDWTRLPLEDETTFNLLNQGKTLGVFQMESGGMQDLACQLHIDNFEEIIAVVSLYRPGPMDMIPSFINRKHGREPIEYDHPWMKDILSETYGVMVYQEQVMQIAQTLANYSLGEGDILRKAMGKKDAEQMALQREKFRTGAMGNDIPEQQALAIFDKMAKFAAYGFNKSHAAAYSYLAYTTAYLKANYPTEWMAALLTCDRDDISKVAKFLRESQNMGIHILPPDVNISGTSFTPTDEGIRFALSAVKGVGEGVVQAIIEEREKKGPYKGLYDFFQRLDPKKVGKKTVENLVLAGAFDFTKWDRDALLESIEAMHSEAVRQRKEQASGVMNFLSLMGEDPQDNFSKPPEVQQKWVERELLMKEKELLGFFVTGHPLHACRDLLQRLCCIPLAKVKELDRLSVIRTAFIVEGVSVKISNKTQRKFAFLQISDGVEHFDLPVWPDLFEAHHELLKENQLLYAVIAVEEAGSLPKLSCKWLGDVGGANEEMIRECDEMYDKAKQKIAFQEERKKRSLQKKQEAKQEEKMELVVNLDTVRLSHLLDLKTLLMGHPGSEEVTLSFQSENHEVAKLFLDKSIQITWKEELKKKIEKNDAFSLVSQAIK